MNPILITGGAGFVGSNLARLLCEQKLKIRILDNFSTGSMKNLRGLPAGVKIFKGDICDTKLLKNAVKGCKSIVHLAAQTSVALSVKDPLITQEVNSEGTLKLLIAAKDAGTEKIIFFSSCAVYGDSGKMPSSAYGATKLAGELYCKTFLELYGLKTIILRPFNIFGPRQNPNSEYSAVIPKFISAALRGKPPVIFGDGAQTRDFIYVNDIINLVHNLLASNKDRDCRQSYEIGSGKSVSVNELARAILSLISPGIKPKYGPERAGEVKHSTANPVPAKKCLGFSNITPFQKALKETVSWYVHSNS
ncbi:MAG: NAD-dependent epimerase/dehydratase family protein [Planctomycetes bacterium]|nr:NAD-dependent epimerase/dehydratase family protein [Planctomycetota bacterium]